MSHPLQNIRTRGKAYETEEGSWSWEAVITVGDMSPEDPEAIVLGPKADAPKFLSKDAAIDNMRLVTAQMLEMFGEDFGVPKNEIKFQDLSKGISEPMSKREFLRKGPFGKRYF